MITEILGYWTIEYKCRTVKYVEKELKRKVNLSEDRCEKNVSYGAFRQSKVCYCHTELCNKPEESDYIDPDPKGSDSKDPDTKDPDNKDPDSKDPDSKNPDTKDPDSKDPDTKDP